MKGCKKLSMNNQETKNFNNRKEIKSEIKVFLRKKFKNEIFKLGSFYTVEFYSIERKELIFNNMLNTLFNVKKDDKKNYYIIQLEKYMIKTITKF